MSNFADFLCDRLKIQKIGFLKNWKLKYNDIEMTKRARTILFSICAILFLLIAPSVVLYSQGYRIDFGSKRIVQIGGFYFKVWPKNAQVLIDGKLKNKTDVLFGSVFIKNLLPRKYEIEVKKEGYLPWKKTLEVQEKMVTEAKNVVLIPENPKFTILEDGVKNYYFSPDGKNLILESEEEIKLLKIEREIKEYQIENANEEEIESIIFSPDSQKILFKIGSKFKLLDLTKTPLSLIDLDFLEVEIKEISFHPGDLTKIFFIKDEELFWADLEKKEVLPLVEDILTCKILNKEIYCLDNSGFLFKTDFAQKIKERINNVSFEIKELIDYQLEIFGNFIFLKEKEQLFWFNLENSSFEKFLEPIKSLKISPDFGKIVYFNNHEIFVFFLKDSFDQPLKKDGEKVFLTRFSEKIGDLLWYTAHYLIFNTDSKIKIVEIDDRDGINIYELPESISQDSKIFFNEIDKKIYLLNEGGLFVSEKLIP